MELFSRGYILSSPKLDQLRYHLPGASITRGKYLTSNSVSRLYRSWWAKRIAAGLGLVPPQTHVYVLLCEIKGLQMADAIFIEKNLIKMVDLRCVWCKLISYVLPMIQSTLTFLRKNYFNYFNFPSSSLQYVCYWNQREIC